MTLPLESKEPLLAADLHRVLATARIFAGKDNTLPMLTCVKLQATGTHLIAVATDRFNLGAAACKYDGEPFELMLAPEAQAVLLAAVNPGKGSLGRLRTVGLRRTPKGRYLYVAVRNGEDSVSLALRPSTAEFPAWRQLIPEKMPMENTVAVIGLDPVRLAKFGQVRKLHPDYSSPQFFFTSPSKPVVCRMGDDFIGLLMPIRLPGEETGELRPKWMG